MFDRSTSRRQFMIELGAAGAALSMFPGAASAATTLQYANASNAQNITNQFVTRFAQRVAEGTGNQIKMEFLLNMGSEQSIVEGLSLGTLDLAMTGYTGMPEFDVFYTPFLLRDLPHGVKVFDGPLGRQAAEALQKKLRLRLLGVGSTGPFVLAIKQPIRSWADIKGKKIRVPPFDSYTEAVKALGAVPTPVPFNEIYSALQQGVVDGVITVLNVLVVNKFLEVCKYCVRNDFGVGLDKFVVSDASWNKMTEQQRDAVTKSFKDMQMSDWVKTSMSNATDDFTTWEKVNGPGTVLNLDVKEIEPILQPIGRRRIGEIYGPQAYDLLNNA